MPEAARNFEVSTVGPDGLAVPLGTILVPKGGELWSFIQVALSNGTLDADLPGGVVDNLGGNELADARAKHGLDIAAYFRIASPQTGKWTYGFAREVKRGDQDAV